MQWLRERLDTGVAGRLFTAQVERVRAQYMFTPQMFLRAVVQNQRTSFNPEIFGIEGLQRRNGALASQLLFAYKLNWQSVLYVGYGDIRDVTEEPEQPIDPQPGVPPTMVSHNVRRDLLLSNRQLFFKLSYAFQR
jgi:hypothetical protein